MPSQITSHVVMIRPARFGYNPETADNNAFQQITDVSSEEVAVRAVAEFDQLVDVLREEGVEVRVIRDTPDPVKPDAVFPNNWFSMHANGVVVTYPMYSPLRRLERRPEIIDALRVDFEVTRRVHFESWEENDEFLEGTGSLIPDRVHRIVYACKSARTHPDLLDVWCEEMGYRPVLFEASLHGQPIYHTNVMMALGEGIAVICLEVIEAGKRDWVREQLAQTGHEIVELTPGQLDEFAGNMLALANQEGKQLMVMSSRAFHSLRPDQAEAIRRHARIVHSDVATIEQAGGGSVRCMIAENFLKPIQA